MAVTDDGREAGLSALLKQLANEASELVHGEVELAKLEMRAAVQHTVRGVSRLAVAGGFALLGALSLVAALILGLADLLGGRHGLAALIVGVVFLLIGALLGWAGARGIGDAELRPAATLETLGKGGRLAATKAKDLRAALSGARATDEIDDATLAAATNTERIPSS